MLFSTAVFACTIFTMYQQCIKCSIAEHPNKRTVVELGQDECQEEKGSKAGSLRNSAIYKSPIIKIHKNPTFGIKGRHSLQEHSSPCHFFIFDLNDERDSVFLIS